MAIIDAKASGLIPGRTKAMTRCACHRFFSGEARTYLMFFAINTELLEGESASTLTMLAEDEWGLKFQMPVDSLRRVPNFDGLTQIVVRMPNELIGAREVRVSFNLRGASSNTGIKVISNENRSQ